MTAHSAEVLDSVDSVQTHLRPLAVGVVASVVLHQSHPLPIPKGGHFLLASDQKGAPSSSLGAIPVSHEEPGMQPPR